jgi:hypothetical protein
MHVKTPQAVARPQPSPLLIGVSITGALTRPFWVSDPASSLFRDAIEASSRGSLKSDC